MLDNRDLRQDLIAIGLFGLVLFLGISSLEILSQSRLSLDFPFMMIESSSKAVTFVERFRSPFELELS